MVSFLPIYFLSNANWHVQPSLASSYSLTSSYFSISHYSARVLQPNTRREDEIQWNLLNTTETLSLISFG